MVYTACGVDYNGRSWRDEYDNEADALAHFELAAGDKDTRYAYVERSRGFHYSRKGLGELLVQHYGAMHVPPDDVRVDTLD